MWLKAPNLNCIHGFSTRHGGISLAPFNTLNLGGSEDERKNILENRNIALNQLGLSLNNLCNLKQVHGNKVSIAKPGLQEGDALVTQEKNLILAVSIADCYPILLFDEVNKVTGAIHAGWRGTVAGIARTTVNAMLELGAKAENINAAIGQGISQPNFEVGGEVIEEFEKNNFPAYCWKNNRIDLSLCNVHVLKENKIPEQNIWRMSRCTFEKDFFSYRRDKGKTGRMWAVIAMKEEV